MEWWRIVLLSLVLWACADEWQYANVQLDLLDADWQRESRVRICVQDQQVQESALQAGRVAVDFLSFPLELTIQLLPPLEEGSNPSHHIIKSISKEGYYSEQWHDCATMDCTPCQTESLNNSGSVLLAVRLDPDEREE